MHLSQKPLSTVKPIPAKKKPRKDYPKSPLILSGLEVRSVYQTRSFLKTLKTHPFMSTENSLKHLPQQLISLSKQMEQLPLEKVKTFLPTGQLG